MTEAPKTHPSQKLLASNELHEGYRITVRLDTLELEDGTEVTRDVIVHPGAVGIVPVLPDGSVILIRQWRHAPATELLEIPAGTLEPGEPPIETARRELIEETGYEAGSMEPVTSFYTTPGFTDEVLHVFIARDLKAVPMDLDDGEIIEPITVGRAEAMAMCRDGRIQDAKTMIGLLMTDQPQ
ncbi:MAG TPA: NUDIX hydrolase [Armatimonadota bacterium]|nr:NUDIX hydrolase [Armatimonadota bacterium]